MFICHRATGAQRFRGLVRNETHRRRPRRYKFEFSFSVGNDRLPSHKSGTRRENRNASDSPDLSPSIPDDRGYLRFRVFISRQNLGRSGNGKIPDRLGFSRHENQAEVPPWSVCIKTALRAKQFSFPNLSFSKFIQLPWRR